MRTASSVNYEHNANGYVVVTYIIKEREKDETRIEKIINIKYNCNVRT